MSELGTVTATLIGCPKVYASTVPRCPSEQVTPAATLEVAPTRTGPDIIVTVWLVLVPMQVLVVVVEPGELVVEPFGPSDELASNTTERIATRTTATDTHRTGLRLGVEDKRFAEALWCSDLF